MGDFTSSPRELVQDKISLGEVPGAIAWSKFGLRDLTSAAAGEQTLWPINANFVVMTSADTLDIAYNSTTDGTGGGATGATTLLIDYIDANFLLQSAIHVLGTDGSDTTSFTCLGVNRAVVVASGSGDANINDITFTVTTGGNNQAQIPAGLSVTHQCIFHVPIGVTGLVKHIHCAAQKLSGSSPSVEFNLWSYNRLTETNYNFWSDVIDTQSDTITEFSDSVGMSVSGRDVLYLTMNTTQNNTIARARFSLNTYGNSS